MIIKLFLGYLKTQLKRTNLKVDEDNGKSTGIWNGQSRKFCWLSRYEFWKNIGCLVSYTTFGFWFRGRICGIRKRQ